MDTVKINHGNTKMIAHRGLSGIEQENTNAAFVAAGNRSYYGIETDVHRTADGQYVIIHDDTTARVTNGAWDVNVEQVPYRDIQAILLPDRDGSCIRQDLRIPLLAEYVRICKRYEKVCVLELKNPFLREDIENIIEIVRGEEYLSNVIFIAFSLENCTQLRELLPGQRIQWLLSQPVDEEVKQTLLQHHLDIDLDYLYMSKALVEELHAGHIKVNCWTCNDSGTAGELIAMGVDFITTNILE